MKINISNNFLTIGLFTRENRLEQSFQM